MPRKKPEIVLENGFRTEDGRYPYYIRAVEEARGEYQRLKGMQFEVLRPGEALLVEEFVELAHNQGAFEVVRRNDPNDDGYRMLAVFGSDQEAAEFYGEIEAEGRDICQLSEILDEDDFVKMAVSGRLINLAKTRSDKTIQVRRGIIIGASESFLSIMNRSGSTELQIYAKDVSDEDARRTAEEYEA